MRRRLLATALGIATFFTLLFGVGAGHSLLSSSVMSDMGKQMSLNQCQSSCTSQSPLATPGQKSEVDEKDIEPLPAETHYLTAGVGWTTTITVAAAYLFRYLRWQPPDLYKLNAVYRI